MRFELTVDRNNQWFVQLWVSVGGRKALITFKVDSGCNSLVLSHRTLGKLGILTDKDTLAKLPEVPGKLASGDIHTYRKLGAVSLYQNKGQTAQICKVDAICHSTRETHDLLGTEVFRRFSGVSFNLVGDKYVELK
jgi:hypothetical protein